ncbi:hypothetical protein HPB51_027999 [Rhipicephalus microplus]|uniref:Uncharacterized protein n=1 Tax=Rhipicephalus microplus TaxID=6941 RepID=A0A9J6CYP9_RHIMP|nr:hypothetical protein HPB51_027999 [Rhipicephalus microplus]
MFLEFAGSWIEEDEKFLGSVWGPADFGEDISWPCPIDLVRLVDFESARLSFWPSVAQRLYSSEEDVRVADVSVSFKPSTGLSRMTTSMPTMQQQRAADNSTIQDATTKERRLREESTNQREGVLVDSGYSMDVHPSGGLVIPAKRAYPVIVQQQVPTALKQPPKKVRAIPDNASKLSASQYYPTPAPSQSYRVDIHPLSCYDITSVPTKHVQRVID